MNLKTSLADIKPPTVTFLGAAHGVSGSIHLIEAGKHRFLLDCGLFRGPREEARMRNSFFAFDPTKIDAIFLSHAHMDHCGNIPNLVRQGFSGPIYCTHPTRDLIAVMLEDSARVHERENGNGQQSRSSRDAKPALFDLGDIEKTMALCVGVEYLETIVVNQDVRIRFMDSGHILGSAMIAIKLIHAECEYTITFTGDLGRRGVPFVAEPCPVPPADLIICESTYGGKLHDSLEMMSSKMSKIANATFERGGKVLIPAFSLGRTHLVLHYVRKWMASGQLPRIPIYVDSPLAQKVDGVFEKYRDCVLPKEHSIACEWLETEDDAWFRTTQREPCIIIASGGMCEGGRIVQHLKQHIDDPRSTVVLVSYQAPNSLGAQLLSHTPTVRFHGRTWNKWIEVAEVKGFSGHADKNDFDWLLRDAVKATGKVRLVHGEPEQLNALAGQLREMGFADVAAPKRQEKVVLARMSG
jgi:metallo-beta-lactamase family protein